MQQTVEGKKAPTRTVAEPRPSTSRERRRSVADEGQADHRAIVSNTTSPRPQGSANLVGPSNQLQVPKLDLTGRSPSSVTTDSAKREIPKERPGTERYYSAEEH